MTMRDAAFAFPSVDVRAAADNGSETRKSPFLGVVYSALLPGMGELYADRFDRGIYALVADGVLWLGVLGFDRYGAWLRDDARLFAAAHAGVDPAGKDDQFFVNIENYISLDEYNASKLVDRDLASVYPEDVARGYRWQWDDDANRKAYRDQRIRSDQMYNAVGFFVLGLVANRIWSAVESAIFVRDFNRIQSGSSGSMLILRPDRPLFASTTRTGWCLDLTIPLR